MGTEAVKRIRGRALQRMRSRVLRANPLCVHCAAAGKVAEAVEMDHIVALTNGGTNDEGNMQGLCLSCHADKTARDLGFRVKIATGLDGWPVDDRATRGVPQGSAEHPRGVQKSRNSPER
jgi:5-methylcytosine-specific restriction protein A